MGENAPDQHLCDPPQDPVTCLPGTEWQCAECGRLWEVQSTAGIMAEACNVWTIIASPKKIPTPTRGPLLAPTTEEKMLVDLVTAARAWADPGPHPSYHRAAQQRVRELMPILGDALDAATARWHGGAS